MFFVSYKTNITMNPKLSIIIPCYNCSKTLKEAVDSCFTQGLNEPLEIVMVDDGSTDGTRDVMQSLSKQHENIRLFFHETNKGGGATRNTAVAHSQGEVIFCLDSDDILPPQTLPMMITLLNDKKCDGIIFDETRFFETSINKTERSQNKIECDVPVSFMDIFRSKGFLTQVNFLYTKKAFSVTGGYPENHGFDTQDFGCRFLAQQLKVYKCPNAYYLHRRNQKKKSYFERVYSEGDLSINTYLIYEKVLNQFPDEVISLIMGYDIFSRSKLGEKNLTSEVTTLLENIGYQGAPATISNTTNKENLFRKATTDFIGNNFSTSIDTYKQILVSGFSSPVIFWNIMRCSVALSGVKKSTIESETKKIIASISNSKPKKNSTLRRIINYILRHKQKQKWSILS